MRPCDLQQNKEFVLLQPRALVQWSFVLDLRCACVEDAETLWKAECETATVFGLLVSRPHELQLEAFQREIERLSRDGRYVVAVREGRIVGHASLSPMTLEALAHVFRLTIVVHRGETGQGVGTVLMNDLIAWAREDARVRKIELNVRATNDRAIALYEKLGFVEEGRFRNRVRLPDGSFVDDLAMAWFPKRGES